TFQGHQREAAFAEQRDGLNGINQPPCLVLPCAILDKERVMSRIESVKIGPMVPNNLRPLLPDEGKGGNELLMIRGLKP
ncbi:MAG: hypothetical protein JSV42_19195, partial [Chloroflexota bacterium]